MCQRYIQHVGFINLETAMDFLLDTVTPIQLVFPFLLTETSQQESILLILFPFSDNTSYPLNVFHRIARIVIYNYVNRGESRF